MKKVVVASLLAVASVAVGGRSMVAQTQENTGAAAQSSGGIQMSPAEYKAYNDAISQTNPQAKAAALESYLTAYPNSQVKAATLQNLMITYSGFDAAKTLSTADKLLQVQPDNLRALALESIFHKQEADKATDPAAKQAALDQSASFAQKALSAAKPADMNQADFDKLKESVTPSLYSAIAADAAAKKDMKTAIDNYTKELKAAPPAATTTPGAVLQDTYYLGLAYYQSTPPDYLNCTWFTARAAAFAPEPYKSEFLKVATYCYKKYHGNSDGYDAAVAGVQSNLFPPPTWAASVKPAPSPADIVAQVIASTPDLSTLAISDKEFILQNGKPEDAAKVWDTIKGKSVELPDVTVVSATENQIQASVSDDAVQSKTADFTFNMKEPLKTVPAPGTKITLSGTYSSYTVGGQERGTAAATPAAPGAAAAPTTAPTTGTTTTPPAESTATPPPAGTATPAAAPAAAPGPVMIIMSDAAVSQPKAPAKKPAATHHRTAPSHRRR
ncbi:MAG TPA: hypothetical protein VFE38_10800 [Edaphobacter sp.]|nr:hypothetical protein [Edaphobacter sp.]